MDRKIKCLAEDIEQYMFERGEYDIKSSARIRWVLSGSRRKSADEIGREIESGDVRSLMTYFTIDVRLMDKNDELIPKAKALYDRLEDIQWERELNGK